MNKKNRGYNAYFILVLLLMALLVIPSFLDNSQIEYTRGELVTDLEAGKCFMPVYRRGVRRLPGKWSL